MAEPVNIDSPPYKHQSGDDRPSRFLVSGCDDHDGAWFETCPLCEIERLRERCEVYKGQVKCGAEEIERLRAVLVRDADEQSTRDQLYPRGLDYKQMKEDS